MNLGDTLPKLNVVWHYTGDTIDTQCRYCMMETHYTYAAPNTTIIEDARTHYDHCPARREKLHNVLLYDNEDSFNVIK